MRKINITFLFLLTGMLQVFAHASEGQNDHLSLIPPHSILKNGGVKKHRLGGNCVSLCPEKNRENFVLRNCPLTKEAGRVEKLQAAQKDFERERTALMCLQIRAEQLGIGVQPDQAPFPVRDPRAVRITARSEMALGISLAVATKREQIRVQQAEKLQELRALSAQVSALQGRLVERTEALRFADRSTYFASKAKACCVERSDTFRGKLSQETNNK